jgi:hypothetical protein
VVGFCHFFLFSSDTNQAWGFGGAPFSNNLATTQLVSVFVNAQNVPTNVPATQKSYAASNFTYVYTATAAGDYKLTVTYLITPMKAFPFASLSTTVRPAAFNGPASVITGNGIVGGQALSNATFDILTRDVYQNVRKTHYHCGVLSTCVGADALLLLLRRDLALSGVAA